MNNYQNGKDYLVKMALQHCPPSVDRKVNEISVYIQELVDRATPKEVKTDSMLNSECPSCYSPLELLNNYSTITGKKEFEEEIKYCPYCGQRLE